MLYPPGDSAGGALAQEKRLLTREGTLSALPLPLPLSILFPHPQHPSLHPLLFANLHNSGTIKQQINKGWSGCSGLCRLPKAGVLPAWPWALGFILIERNLTGKFS